jgi:hypothetical protein
MWHVWVRVEVHIEFWWGNQRERDNLEDISLNGIIVLKYIFKKCG